MSIIIYILIVIFGFLLINYIFEYCLNSIEGLTGGNMHSLAGKVGWNGRSITNLKATLDKTLNRSKKLLIKVNSAGKTNDVNKATVTHLSTQSLNLKVKPVTCEGFQNKETLNKLQSDSISHAKVLGSLQRVIPNINTNIKDIQNEINRMKKK